MAAIAAIFAIRCSDEPPAGAPRCSTDQDCKRGGICAGGRCATEEGIRLDAGSIRDAGWTLFDGGRGEAGQIADAGVLDTALMDIAPTSMPDAFFPDALTADTASAAEAGAIDAAIRDASAQDAAPPFDAGGPSDARPRDASSNDGAAPDAVVADTGVAGQLQRGIYAYRRILTPGIPSNAELTQLAISPDGRTLLASAVYDRIYTVDIASSSSTISATLPKDDREPIRVEAIAHARDGQSVLIAATAILAGGSVEGRIYRAGPRLRDLAEVASRSPGQVWQRIAVDPASGATYLLGHRPISGGSYTISIARYVDGTRTMSPVAQDVTGAGVQDLAIAADGLGGRGLVFAGGVGGGLVGHYDSTGVFSYGPATGNTAHLAARPQGDYALAVTWSSGTLARFQTGVWTVGSSAVSLGTTAVWNVAFSDDGGRALITGAYSGNSAVLREYRHDLYSEPAVTDVSIPGFNVAPWFGTSGVNLNAAAWRPGGDCGFISGGCSSGSCTRGYLIAFELGNGRACR